ncbi:MAG: heme exporter protein CcmB [Pseudomonadota bacterium]|nr:heme exporter protein CcmB [Pseudomonadota bacterium]
MSVIAAILGRDLRLALRQGADAATGLVFFIIVATLFTLAIGPEPRILARVAGAVLMVAALLSATLSFDRLFQQDFEDGTLDQLLLAPPPLEWVVLIKCAGHWLTSGLPLVVVAPLLAVFMNLPPATFWVTMAAVLMATPALSLIGAVGAALAVGARRAGVLVAVLVLPLAVPVLIFAVSAIDAAALSAPTQPHLMLLGAVLAATAALAPWAAAAALRQAVT